MSKIQRYKRFQFYILPTQYFIILRSFFVFSSLPRTWISCWCWINLWLIWPDSWLLILILCTPDISFFHCYSDHSSSLIRTEEMFLATTILLLGMVQSTKSVRKIRTFSLSTERRYFQLYWNLHRFIRFSNILCEEWHRGKFRGKDAILEQMEPISRRTLSYRVKMSVRKVWRRMVSSSQFTGLRR